MKNKYYLLLLIALLVVLVAVPGSTLAKGKGASAKGHGLYQFIDPIGGEDEYDETFKLNARVVNGQVKGKVTLVSGKNNENVNYLLVKGEVDCLRVKVDGKTAVISGTVTEFDYPSLPDLVDIGDEFWVQVQDNGRGRKGDPDLKSEIFINHLYRRLNEDEFLNDCSVDYPLRDAGGAEIANPYQELFLPGGNYMVMP